MDGKPINSIELKRYNRNRIFKQIYKEGQVSKNQLASDLNMSLPTVTQNLRALAEQNLIKEEGSYASTGGRKAKAIAVNTEACFAIGVDITRNHAVVVVVDLGVNIIKNTRVRIPFENTPGYFQAIGKLVGDVVSESGIDRDRLLGVGISVPGLLSEDRREVVYATVLGFTGGHADDFAEYIPYRCVLSNDASAAGVAELWNSDSVENIVYLSLSNSVGGSIYLNKGFYHGEQRRSAEFGHMTIIPGGKLCYCGQKGCVDAYCNSLALSENADGDLRKFFSLLRDGSEEHEKIWEEYMQNLVLIINSLRMAFDCRVILGGYVGSYIGDEINRIREIAAGRNSFEKYGDYIEVCRYKIEASAVGAAVLFFEDYIKKI